VGTAAKFISPMAMHVKAFQVREFLEDEVWDSKIAAFP
jgi:hypothetical protein